MKTLLLIAAALPLAAMPLRAEPPRDTAPVVAVTYGDLDLTSADGRATLDRRLRAAARTVCRAELGASPLYRLARRGCQRDALAEARQDAAFAAADAQSRLLLAERGRDR